MAVMLSIALCTVRISTVESYQNDAEKVVCTALSALCWLGTSAPFKDITMSSWE